MRRTPSIWIAILIVIASGTSCYTELRPAASPPDVAPSESPEVNPPRDEPLQPSTEELEGEFVGSVMFTTNYLQPGSRTESGNIWFVFDAGTYRCGGDLVRGRGHVEDFGYELVFAPGLILPIRTRDWSGFRSTGVRIAHFEAQRGATSLRLTHRDDARALYCDITLFPRDRAP